MAERTVVRFVGVGLLNTLTDVALFMLLHDRLGIVGANIVSTSAGMCLSFLANGLFTFRAERLSLRQAVLFVGTNVLTLWVVQPVLIRGLVTGGVIVLAAKLIGVGCCTVLNFVGYRRVVWPPPSPSPTLEAVSATP